MNAILKRKSTRDFTKEMVTEEQINRILHAGMSAPSANNEKPWHFIVVKERAILDQLGADAYSDYTKKTDLAIVVCADEALENKSMPGFSSIDCNAAIQNMLIEIEALELGSVWLVIHPVQYRADHVRKLLELPEGIIPYAVLPVGYPTEKHVEQDRYDATRVHVNKW